MDRGSFSLSLISPPLPSSLIHTPTHYPFLIHYVHTRQVLQLHREGRLPALLAGTRQGPGGTVHRPCRGPPHTHLHTGHGTPHHGEGMFIKYFSLYSVYVQCKSFAKLTFYYYMERRITVKEIMDHPWVMGPTPTSDVLVAELTRRFEYVVCGVAGMYEALTY